MYLSDRLHLGQCVCGGSVPQPINYLVFPFDKEVLLVTDPGVVHPVRCILCA